MDEMPDTTACPLCHGTKVLTQWGIARIYLLARPIPPLLILAGIVLSVMKGPSMLIISAVGYVLPLITADMRLSLYPIVAISKLLGKRPNCPKCEPGVGVFREH